MNVQTLPMLRFIDHEGVSVNQLPAWADLTTLTAFYKDMVLTRTYDNKAVALQRTGKLGTYPSHLGSEAYGVAIGHAMHPRDVFIPYYRDMPAMWVRGIPMEKNLQYWGGDERGSDFHVTPANGEAPEPCRDLPFCVPIATQCTHAVGVAAALKIENQHHAALVTCGDGATSKGDFLESINCAGAWNLPLVFVLNNNQWAISVPRTLQSAAEFLSDKAKGAGIHGVTVDGNDVVAVYDTVLAALDRARKGKGPTLIEAVSYRLSDHTTADDASRYRSDDELNQAWQFEPIKRLKTFLINQGAWSDAQEETWLLACKEQVEIAVDHYMNLPPQAPESAFDYLYEHAPAELNQQRDLLINKAMRMQGGKHG
ncbi:pyruvate dehydrogenase (acetyl-transferring) E1 component subunit alpha [Vibrio europaeus]|uniref:pyruvate dehydrogenase (acetyl-transferring) E1 component subunit alpha n=1 Tax=Vibrio europaeus TaxID=300876 RepID=UPI00233F3CAF|nr:pyruvate dehydrogenase (acetyl-transferring) E1 component subunit alpha [Vibrio europaeus]MDC5806109.1 pyruvate dehydrogenase (acetyl-transferring) E1 component subunit alpha [Vibrio europaeus]MDC5825538.1 pyruvate dehydrogenase (acetyl-transferring) E1 component subunit alpha [Vibrio europaeus]MDC5831182.1 pyruvate dehydrogenase (acetyl-transferring) E1 component subunit alpha [Vibrio europaeus]MDC5834138.1 pyruvate dehydrogenase (acetyl-transferring) E1 component subunit alpha [Vibrio euro